MLLHQAYYPRAPLLESQTKKRNRAAKEASDSVFFAAAAPGVKEALISAIKTQPGAALPLKVIHMRPHPGNMPTPPCWSLTKNTKNRPNIRPSTQPAAPGVVSGFYG